MWKMAEIKKETGSANGFSVILEFEESKMLVTVPGGPVAPDFLEILEAKLHRIDEDLCLVIDYR